MRQVIGGVVLKVEVSPGSAKQGWAGYDQWREAVKVRISAEPRGGKANDALTSLVSETFGVAQSAVRIISGGRSRVKEVMIAAVSVEEARARLAGVVGD